MSNVKQMIEKNYNGYTEEELEEYGLECYGLGIPFDLYDDDTFWLTNDTQETSK